MKRIAILICILCLMPALGMIPAANAAQQTYTVGDADGNGIIDVRDVTLIQRILAELVSDEAGTISQRGDVDEDIYRETLAEMRSMQVVRRLVIQGSLTAEKGEEENADAATEIWSRAFRRNPRDPMLLDRLDRLARNAGALIRMGNLAAAAKCYETMIVINPTDASAVFNYGICLKRLGKKEMSEQVLERAKELNK